jgi:tetratricopeptide (TPR) repeat protein
LIAFLKSELRLAFLCVKRNYFRYYFSHDIAAQFKIGGCILTNQQPEITQSQARKLEKVLLKSKKRSEVESRQLVDVYFALGKYQQTINLIKQGTKQYLHWQQDLPLLLLLSRAYCSVNKLSDGLLVLQQSVQLNQTIDNAEAVLGLVQLYNKEFNLCKVEELAPLLLKWQNYHLQGLLALIENAGRLGDKNLLAQRLLKVIPYYQSLTNPVYLCTMMMRCNLLDESQKLLSLYEGHLNHAIPSLQADIAIAHKDYAKAVALLIEQETSVSPYTCYRKALALDKLGEFVQAFDYFNEAAALRQKEFGTSNNKDLLPFFKLTEASRSYTKTKVGEELNTDTESTHVFIFGFPRSGTTLLDNVLDTQKNLRVVSELPVLFFVKKVITESLGYKYPEDLVKISDEDLTFLRSFYFIKTRQMGFCLNEQDILIDKSPHHSVDLPLIKLLFPKAKLILCLRHPLDVCLSCFQQDFNPIKNNLKLITLDNIVKRYQQVFLLLEKYATNLGFDIFTVKYEDLVQDFDKQISQVFDFMNYQPVEDYSNFHQHAAQKYVQSSSRGQTDKPLYTTSLYRWRNYAEQLGPFIPQLTYFIDKFGYDSNNE